MKAVSPNERESEALRETPGKALMKEHSLSLFWMLGLVVGGNV